MRDRIRKIAAGAAVALGTAHLIYGMLAFKALTPDHIWFAGAGVAMICVGLANWTVSARFQTWLMTAYVAVMAFVIPLPQVFLGLVIFSVLTLCGLQRRYA